MPKPTVNALECYEMIDKPLSQARGIMFVFQQAVDGGGAGVVSDELEGYAIWAVNDLLEDAAKALEQLHSAPKRRGAPEMKE